MAKASGNILETDVLVVGGGGAGAATAWAAYQAGARVLMAVKGRFASIGTRGGGATGSANSESGGFRAPGVSPRFAKYTAQQMYEDIVQAGLGMADPRLARILAEEAEDARLGMDKLGLTHNWDSGMGVKSHGIPMMIVLENAIRHSDIVLKERTMVTDLLTRDGACVGAVAVDESGETWTIKAPAVILATGGHGNLYMHTLDPSCVTGDGYAMGYRAGAELMNMEFGQSYISSVYPGKTFLSGAFARYLKTVTNREGRHFIQDYLPAGATMEELIVQHLRHGPFSTRDSLSRYASIAMVKETIAGRANTNMAFGMDVSDRDDLGPDSLEFFWYRCLDPRREPFQVNCAEQCSHGGLRLDENAQTAVRGLYAAGETGSGYHGVDRLSGCMLACTLVFGARAGKHAAMTARGSGRQEPLADQVSAYLQRIEGYRSRRDGLRPCDVTAILQRRAWEDVMIARSADSLNRFLGTVGQVREEMEPKLSASTPLEVQQAAELHNLLLVGEIVASAALFRTESRGSHYREDHPERDDAQWLKAVTLKHADGKMRIGTLVLDPGWKSRPGDLGQGRWG
ncbi:MAG: FAD-binding protein [Chloroflexi bacterium]|nr:FAD-binding protein [Chloroflexota bacterium]MCL5025106.1 FAD-binding protein [Chloroflexota bacterium]